MAIARCKTDSRLATPPCRAGTHLHRPSPGRRDNARVGQRPGGRATTARARHRFSSALCGWQIIEGFCVASHWKGRLRAIRDEKSVRNTKLFTLLNSVIDHTIQLVSHMYGPSRGSCGRLKGGAWSSRDPRYKPRPEGLRRPAITVGSRRSWGWHGPVGPSVG